MTRLFIWQFKLNLTAKSDLGNLPSLVSQEKLSDEQFELRYFFEAAKEVVLSGLDESALWLSSYEFVINNDIYLINPNDDKNLKVRKKKLHIKPFKIRKNNVECFEAKQKIHLLKETDMLQKCFKQPLLKGCANKAEVLALLEQKYQLVPVYKEALIFKGLPDNIRIEFSRLSVNKMIFHSISIESNCAEDVLFLRGKIGLSKMKSQNYVAFLKGIL